MPLPIFKQNASSPLFLAVASGKGGVGKSTLAVNLAYALKEAGLRPALLDADLYGPSLRRLLPEEAPPRIEGGFLIPALSSGIPFISSAFFQNEWRAAALRGPLASRLIGRFLSHVDWGESQIVVIDFPPGTGDIPLTLAQEAPLQGALLVTTPQKLALLDVKKAKELFDQTGIPVIGLVENMSYLQRGEERLRPFGRGGGEELAKEWGLPLLGTIPLSEEICLCSDRGKPLFSSEKAVSEGLPRLISCLAAAVVSALKSTRQEAFP